MKNILFIDFFKYNTLYNSIINELKKNYTINYNIVSYNDVINKKVNNINEYSIIIFFCEDDDKIINIIKSYQIPLISKLQSLEEIIENINKHFNIGVSYLKRYNKKKFIKSNLIKYNQETIEDDIIIPQNIKSIKFDKIILFIDYERNKIIYTEILDKLQEKNINLEFDKISSKEIIKYHQTGKFIINLNKAFVGVFISDDILNLQDIFDLYDKPLLTNKISLNDIINNIESLYNKNMTELFELKNYLQVNNKITNDIKTKTKEIKKTLTNKILNRKMQKLALLK
jgi:hypothetical protein